MSVALDAPVSSASTDVPARRVQVVTTWRNRLMEHTPATWWLPLALVLASELKLRRRPPADTMSGSFDLFIVVELAVFAAVAAYLAVRMRGRMRAHRIVIWMVGYCVTVAVSALYAPTPVLAIVRAFELLVVLLAVLQFDVDGDVAMMRRFLHAFAVTTVVFIVIGAMYVAPQPLSQEGRFTWLYTHSVTTGAMMSIAAVVLFGMWLTYPAARLPWPRYVYAVLFVAVAAGLFFNKTRGSIGGAVLGMLLMSFLWARARGKRDLVVAGAIVTGVIALTAVGPITRYVLRGADTENLASFNNRTQVWEIGWSIVKERPLHGMGFTATRSVFLDQTGLGGAHNAYLNVMVDSGLIGMFWWVGLIGLIVVCTLRVRRRARLHAEASPLTFDTVTILGLMVCSLVNGVTAEMLGAGVSCSAVALFLMGVWTTACEDAMDVVEDYVALEGPT